MNFNGGIKHEKSYLLNKPCNARFVSNLSNQYNFELLSEISQKYNDKPYI